MTTETKEIAPELKKQIDSIMETFDFKTVFIAMTALDWKWGQEKDGEDAVPTIASLKEEARRLLTGMVQEGDSGRGCGGFYVYNKDGKLSLEFVVESKEGPDAVEEVYG